MPSSLKEIAKKIKADRISKGLSQRDLGKKVGIPQSHISKIEQGLVDLQLSSLIEIARTLEMELFLIPRTHITAVQAIEKYSDFSEQIPAYRLGEDDGS